MINVQLKKN